MARMRGSLTTRRRRRADRKSTRLNSSHLVISYAVFCLKKKKTVVLAYVGYLDVQYRGVPREPAFHNLVRDVTAVRPLLRLHASKLRHRRPLQRIPVVT